MCHVPCAEYVIRIPLFLGSPSFSVPPVVPHLTHPLFRSPSFSLEIPFSIHPFLSFDAGLSRSSLDRFSFDRCCSSEMGGQTDAQTGQVLYKKINMAEVNEIVRPSIPLSCPLPSLSS